MDAYFEFAPDQIVTYTFQLRENIRKSGVRLTGREFPSTCEVTRTMMTKATLDLFSAFRNLGKDERQSFLELVAERQGTDENLALALGAALKGLQRPRVRNLLMQVLMESEIDRQQLIEEIEDILDSLLMDERAEESSRPFRDYLAERGQ